ncbi:hypothetical protein COS77_02210 [Candidatus Roizmanbacteria bacterium CG06_land_8_20_14_3_00_34_14]|uniref:UDP-N-acetylenolpyruvoylglucosamine reductase n=3 Tax=Candidatus Roizmaniibacteriota TaxID=1752723 RepID=A0A2M7AUL5_9BACT|nr:MAG: hypothetical protein COT02_02220 [Candidatus Roizmanbacteria bacterium CG07_land_8_20_14_0_80_34_15]PIU74321.1 MAG: hypothetical protein COS77_02210 [Candidatus Roizmanbacteria bacterium CG06_land_8_20_14_3_00_34_14]
MIVESKNIFFLGIKGVAMANIAVILKKMGKNVTGCDYDEVFITDKLLKENNIKWIVGFEPEKLPQETDLIIYSAAHGGVNNPLVIDAIRRKKNIISQAKLIGELLGHFEKSVAVCGCHGKTTTSSLLVYALNKLKLRPSYLVGVPFFSGHQGGDFQAKKYFVVEADEYGVNPPLDKTPKFHLLNPNYIIATNIDFDHPDVYKDIEETKEAFKKFFNNYYLGTIVPRLLFCADDKNLMEVAETLPKENYLTYGESSMADYQITNCKINEDESTFEIKNIGKFKISLFGKHNIYNATAVIAQLLQFGFKQNEIAKSLIGFAGAERRFEKIYFKNNIYLFDDYAHHPAEISATIKAAKSRFPNRKIIVIFQPHTYSRTSSLLKEFADSLSIADVSLILPIFASARENSKNFNVTSKDIVKRIKNSISYFGSKEQIVKKLETTLRDGDVVFTMGAGDVYKLKDKIVKLINSKFETRNSKQTKNSKLKIEKNKELRQFNTLRINSVAEYFLEAKTREDLIEGVKFAHKNELPLFILAGGSNLAIIKEKISGIVIKNNYRQLKILEESDKDVLISVSSGYPISLLVNETVSKGYEGFEYHKGLPGTVGGAIYGNSKWTKPVSYFGESLVMGYLVNRLREVKKVDNNYFRFAYDYSILQETKEILLEAVFKLKKVDSKILKERAEEAFNYRKESQPMGIATSGCFFKNVNGRSSGQLIDQAGLKNFSVGDFYISPKHANFIINRGKGQAKDLIKLVKIIKERVKEKFRVELEEEVIVV